MEIEVGDFVRTKNQGIKRIDTIFENKTVNKYGYEVGSDWDGKWYSYIKTTDIVKHSKQLIDLIEVGDIAEVLVNKRTNEIIKYTIDCKGDLYLLREDTIKTILTHEQINQNCYRLEE